MGKFGKVHMRNIIIIGASGLLGSELIEVFPDTIYTYDKTEISSKNAYKVNITDHDELLFIWRRDRRYRNIFCIKESEKSYCF